ncbi:uncharacterized protein BDW43DRAFT_303845 [Aspergillus alliaceus]|uniref:uncharacterized protein n=1 Tax=Petromyces alliaceus TaxID=209559 RepID=UPI0012A66C84|nr:uncharacterized protein BDW43DRAFT_303845 [Aspergillus alliaceus]KAB8228484.1 hypothetical protein BDW43DRAFT_303845 [Aspergillus alliaceus]
MGEEGAKDSGPGTKSDVNFQDLDGTSPAGQHTPQLASNHASKGAGPSRNNQSFRSSPQAPQSRNFEFVLVTDNESRRQVRRHAMRQYMHQRRLDSIARLGASRIPVGGWTTRPPSDSHASDTSSRVEEVQEEEPANLKAESPPKTEEQPTPAHSRRPSRLLIPKLHKVKREEETSPPVTAYKPSDPRASPGEGGKIDPFSSYPISVGRVDHELIQHFVVTYPSMMYKFAESIANNPMMEIFRQFALHDELPFQAMLAIASKHRAGVDGRVESVQSLTHKMRALRLMNERIQSDSKGQHDGTIYAVATMAVIEKWSKDASIERMHFKGLASMVRNRGGMHGMRASSPFLEKVLYWVDFSCAPKAIYGTSLPWSGNVPDVSPVGLDFIDPEIHLAIPHHSPHHFAAEEGAESLCDQLRACEDFLRFFRRLHELEYTALESPSIVVSENTRQQSKRFGPGTQLYSILTMLPDYDHGIRDVRFIDEFTCMTCLFFLATALYDCYLNSSNFDRYLDWLGLEIKKLNPYTNPSITSVLWFFLNNGGYPTGHASDAGERCWVVSRMIRIAKRLEWKCNGTIWDRLRQVLIDFILTQQECALGTDQVTEEALVARQQKRRRSAGYLWNEDEMRGYILDINLASFTPYSDTNVPVLT